MPNPKVYYSIPGHGEAFAIMNAVIDRDSEVEPPSVGTMRWNVLKYVIRAPRKDGVKDYRKAIDYLRMIIEAEGEREASDGPRGV